MKYTVTGIGAVKSNLTRIHAKLDKQVDAALQGAGLRTVAVAKALLQPYGEDSREIAVEIASVRQSINSSFDPAKKEVMVYAGNAGTDHMAAYLEFGTGKYAAQYVPTLNSAELAKLAMQFYKNGKGTLREHPFLIPAYRQEGKRLIGKLKAMRIG